MSSDRRRLAPRTSEDEALFIANKYAQNKLILEAKLANSLNGGRMVRQTMLDEVASELSAKFNVANRSRKYVEQKLRDMKKEARKFYYIQQNAKPLENGGTKSQTSRTPPEPIRVMIEAMSDELRSGGSWEELDLYVKPMKLEKLDEPLEVERDLPSHQSASSSCESGGGGTCATSYNGTNNEKRTTVSDIPYNIASKSEKCSNATRTDNIAEASAATWQAIYNQSLDALMNIGRDGGITNYDRIKNNNAKDNNSSHKNCSETNNKNAALDFVLSLKHLIEEGGALSGSTTGTVMGDAPTTCAGSAAVAGLTEEMFKTIATSSSLFFPASFYSGMLSVSPESVMPSMMPAVPFFAPAMMGGRVPSSNASVSGSTLRPQHYQLKEENKNLSNPCSPFSASTSNAESPQSTLNGGSMVDANHCQTSRGIANDGISHDAKASTSAKTCTKNLSGAKRAFGSCRVKHSLIKRLGRDNEEVDKTSDESNALNSELGKGERKNVPLCSLNLLRRRLLIEEIAASRAFASLCTEVRKSMEETAKNVINTYQLQSELIQAQIRLLPNSLVEGTKGKTRNNLNTNTEEMTPISMPNTQLMNGVHDGGEKNEDEFPQKRIRMSPTVGNCISPENFPSK